MSAADRPAVSVVVPAYNAARFIERTLATVAAQTFRDFEAVVVDDGSTDGTQGVVEKFLAAGGLAGRCVRQANKKIAGARNAGVREARADLVSFLDHDDLWHPEKLAAVLEEFRAHPETDLVCHDENVTRDGRVVRVTRNGPWVDRMYERLLFDGNALSPSAVTVRKARLLEVGGFREDERFNTVEDYDLWMRLARVCRFRFLDRVLGEYVLVEAAASNKIVYHHANTEALLRDHFAGFPEPGLALRCRMRRRLAVVYRSACRGLLRQGDAAGAGDWARRALATWPFDPKNAAVAGLWALARLSR
ncbi:MAG: glycosyltransferase [Elusimicrobia bacterium]|nr:glycosyltransferase [Elusimicrobiota bacterium]